MKLQLLNMITQEIEQEYNLQWWGDFEQIIKDIPQVAKIIDGIKDFPEAVRMTITYLSNHHYVAKLVQGSLPKKTDIWRKTILNSKR